MDPSSASTVSLLRIQTIYGFLGCVCWENENFAQKMCDEERASGSGQIVRRDSHHQVVGWVA